MDRRPADVELLRKRAEMLATVRAYFADRAVMEVTTPTLSAATTTDPAIESLTVTAQALGNRLYYLQTSPEFSMKRLLAGGAGDCYQIGAVYRDGEYGRWHRPEFTMLEWYRLGFDEFELMSEVEDLIGGLLAQNGRRRPVERLSFAEAFDRTLAIDVHDDSAPLRRQLIAAGIDAPEELDRDALLDLALSTVVASSFTEDALTFIYDYPPSQCALAEIKPGPTPVAARFELFAGGLEIANGFKELTDAAEQRRRFEAELDLRRKRGQRQVPMDEALLAALERGLPACAGVAVGIDRLFAVAVGAQSLDEVSMLAASSDRGAG